jgi:hypothetical protein
LEYPIFNLFSRLFHVQREVFSMRLLILALALVGCLQGTSLAQLRVGDIPDSFYGAQRGRVVAHPHGGFRLHYGRGLTPQGAGVITTAIGTLGPMIPLLVGANTSSSAANDKPAPASAPADPKCMRDDEILDTLASAAAHSTHLGNLKKTEDMLEKLLAKYGIEPTKVDAARKTQTADSGFGPDGKPLGGVTVGPQSAPAAPAAQAPAAPAVQAR